MLTSFTEYRPKQTWTMAIAPIERPSFAFSGDRVSFKDVITIPYFSPDLNALGFHYLYVIIAKQTVTFQQHCTRNRILGSLNWYFS